MDQNYTQQENHSEESVQSSAQQEYGQMQDANSYQNMNGQSTNSYPEMAAQNAKKEQEKKMFRKGLRRGILGTIAVILCITILGGIIYFNVNKSSLLSTTTALKISLIEQIIEEYYYQDVDTEDLREGLYAGLLEALDDPYTAYYTAEETEALEESITGTYAGIGAGLTKDADTGVVSISFVYDDSPAQAAGLQKGDVIISADGNIAADMELTDFVNCVRGETGTTVSIVYERDGEENTVEVERAEIQVPSVRYTMLSDSVGYIYISEFTEGTTEEFEEAIAALSEQGMTSVIYDLRDNPGGLVTSVTDILDIILPEGVTLYMEDKEGNRTEYTSDADCLDYETVVLINENSASASEIFAGAIRDYDYGTLIGTTSYGKGVVQSTVPLTDGSMIKLTTMEYFTPSGENIQGTGIDPDVELEYEFLGSEEDKTRIAATDTDDYTFDDYMLDNQIKAAYELLTAE